MTLIEDGKESGRQRIRKLDAVTIAQIAAGEVVERPGSVLRELVENSVDAGARRIEIDFELGGVELLRVVDDGHGIAAEDLEMALTSHATSKLEKSADLEKIATLGFRGEALASIASVSRVSIQSRPRGAPFGHQVSCEGGVIGPLQPWTGPEGTRIEVRNLFYNTPARKKFLKAQSAETAYLMETVQRLMLAVNRLGEKAPYLLIRNHSKVTLDAPSGIDLRARAEILWGAEVASDLLEVEAKAAGMRLNGVVSNNRIDRSTTKFQHFLVNGRCVRDRNIAHALAEAYRGLLMVGRFPVGILMLEIDPTLVDVNVHPAKAEVRFRDGQAIHHLINKAIRERLRRENIQPVLTLPSPGEANPYFQMAPPLELTGGPKPMPTIPFPGSFATPPSGPSSFSGPRVATPIQPLSAWAPSAPGVRSELEPAPTAGSPSAGGPEIRSVEGPGASFAPGRLPEKETVAIPEGLAQTASELAASPRKQEPPSQGPSGPSPTAQQSGAASLEASESHVRELTEAATGRFLQVYDSYLVVETDKGVMVIDQHALHERILYDQLKQKLQQGPLPMQRLLLPEVVDFPQAQADTLLEQKPQWQALGFEIENYGTGSIAVLGLPHILGNRSASAVFRNLAEKLALTEIFPTREEMLHSLMALLACHSAVRANERLTPEQMEALLAQRHLALDPNHCPHGRPTALFLSRQDLEKQFGRI